MVKKTIISRGSRDEESRVKLLTPYGQTFLPSPRDAFLNAENTTVFTFRKIRNTTNCTNLPTFCFSDMQGYGIKISIQTKFYPKCFYQHTKFILFGVLVEGITVSPKLIMRS